MKSVKELHKKAMDLAEGMFQISWKIA